MYETSDRETRAITEKHPESGGDSLSDEPIIQEKEHLGS